MKACIRTVLGTVALTLAGTTHAGGLFLPADAVGELADDVRYGVKSATVRPSRAAAPDAWERRVRIARQELAVARDDVRNFGSGRLLLNVKDGVDLDVVVERTAPTKWGYSLSGRVAGGHVGFVTLVVHHEAVVGSIWTPGSAYELHSLGAGAHVLRDVTNTPIRCAGALSSEVTPADTTIRSSGTDDVPVDVLVVWTPETQDAYEDEFGDGEASLLARSDWLVAWANDAFERSGAFVSLNLAGAYQLDYNGDWRLAFQRLTDPDDGYMDSVHDRRDDLGADLVYLLRARGGGRAELIGGEFATGSGIGGTFAHEIGHLFGLQHERVQDYSTLRYNRGFTTRRCLVSLMSYGLECGKFLKEGDGGAAAGRGPFYSSPWRYSPSEGTALGVTKYSRERGARGPADAVLTINRNRHRTASRRSRSGGQP